MENGEVQMNWIDEVQTRLKKNNQVLFSKKSDYLQDLNLLFQDVNANIKVSHLAGFRS